MDSQQNKRAQQELLLVKWNGIIAQWQESQMSGMAFCRQRGIVYHQFGYWKRRLVGGDEAPKAAGASVESVAPGFVRLEAESDDGAAIGCGVMVFFVSGAEMRVELERGFDSNELVRVVRVLRQVVGGEGC